MTRRWITAVLSLIAMSLILTGSICSLPLPVSVSTPVATESDEVKSSQSTYEKNPVKPNHTYTYFTLKEVMARYQSPERKVQQVLACGLPNTGWINVEEAIYKEQITAIIKKAEKESGIKSVYGVFVMDLATLYYCGINENLTRIDPTDNKEEGFFNSASVIKLFQGYILCDMMRSEELDKDETYYDSVTGRKFKLLTMITTMISYSDNNYSNATLRLIGNEKSNAVLNRLGIYNSRIYGEMSGALGYSKRNNLTKYGTSKRCARLTPRDAGLILYNVYQNRETDLYMKTMNTALMQNVYNTRIPVGVARVNSKYKVAHKTGTNSELGVYNDAGIIYSKHPYILVAFTQSTNEGAGQAFIRNLAERLTHYFDAKDNQ